MITIVDNVTKPEDMLTVYGTDIGTQTLWAIFPSLLSYETAQPSIGVPERYILNLNLKFAPADAVVTMGNFINQTRVFVYK